MNKKALKWLRKNINSNFEGKTIVITGANSGIGFEVSRYCAYYKMNVIMTVRSLERGQIAKDKIISEFPEAKLDLRLLDVSKEGSIKEFANYITDNNIDIDVFYHNAGVYNIPYQVLDNGVELTTMTNFYGPLMLHSLLKDYFHKLNHEVKVIFTSSIAAKLVKLELEDLKSEPVKKNFHRYSASKKLDAFLMRYLLLHDQNNIKYLLVHPGLSGTSLFNKAFKSKFFVKVVNGFMKIFSNPPWKSALSTIKVMEEDINNGDFYGPSIIYDALGYPKKRSFIKYDDSLVNKTIDEATKICGYSLK